MPDDEPIRLTVRSLDPALSPQAAAYERLLNHLVGGPACQEVLRRYLRKLVRRYAMCLVQGDTCNADAPLTGFQQDMDAAVREDHDG